jgi:hypothetical protein
MHDMLIYYTLWFLVTVGMLWSIRDQNAKTQEMLTRIARYLGDDRPTGEDA